MSEAELGRMPTIDFSQGGEVFQGDNGVILISDSEQREKGEASRGVRRSVSSTGKREFGAGKPALRIDA